MTEVRFIGAATITGFPRDKVFGLEIEGDRLIIKAGKEIFLTVEKEQIPAAEYKHVEVSVPMPAFTQGAASNALGGYPLTPNTASSPSQQAPTERSETLLKAVHRTEVAQHAADPENVQAPEGERTRKPRGPNVVIDENSIIVIDTQRENPYGKLRGKYYETLKTAHGRPVSWWKETSMVKSLEGQPLTMLKFFLSEGVLQLQPPVVAPGQVGASQPQQQPVIPLQPSFAQGQPAGQQVAGPLWAPQTPQGQEQAIPQGPRFM